LQFVVCGRVDNFAVRWRWAGQHPHSRCARGQRIEVQAGDGLIRKGWRAF
jgi:hypothetical protein